MMIMAEGKIHRELAKEEERQVSGWFGPMIDSGFLHSGYVDAAGGRVWMILSSPDLDQATQRLDDLPMVRNKSLSFSAVAVTSLRTA